MTLRFRKLALLCAIAVALLVANATIICSWLAWLGVTGFARWICREYLTGTAICVILAMVWLLRPIIIRGSRWALRQCSVCDQLVPAAGRYCPHCGSRIRC